MLLAALAPWLLVVFTTAGAAVAVMFVLSVLVTAGLGGGLLWLLRPARPGDVIVLALPSGFLAATAAAGLAAASRQVSARAIVLALVVVGSCGVPFVASCLRRCWSGSLSGGWAWVVASTAICVLVFLPAAVGDLRFASDGSFRWIYVDSEWFLALAGQVPRSGPIVIHQPGVAGIPLHYHFGPYVLAGSLAAISKVSVGDALARVVRPIGDLAFAAAAIGLGRSLGRRRGQPALAGAFALIGAICSGSLTWMMAKTGDPTAATPHALLVALPSMPGPCNPYLEMLVGHSILWGSIGLFLMLTLLAEGELRSRVDVRPLLPALVLATNGVAGLAAAGAATFKYALERWRRRDVSSLRTAARIAVVAFAFVSVFVGMGYGGSAGSFLHVDRDPSRNWASFWSFLAFGFGLRLYLLRWMRERDAVDATLPLIATFFGLLAFTFFLEDTLAGNDQYGRLFAEPLAGAAAGALMAIDARRGWRFVVDEVTAMARWVGGSCVLFGIGMVALDAAHHRFHAKSVLATAASGVLWWFARRIQRRRASGVARAVVGTMLVVQAGAFIGPFLGIGLDRDGFAIRTSAGEVAGLVRLRDRLPSDVEVATNHRYLRRAGLTRPWQFDYGALLQHPIYLEGSFYAGDTLELDARAGENLRLFQTRDPAEARSIVERNHIGALVLEPGTSLALATLPPWLEPMRGLGTLNAYLVRVP